MNAIDLLKEDHDVVDQLFKRVEDTPPSKHPPIFKKIKNELDTHAHIEEKVFYPALKAKGNKDLVDITAEGLQEHSQIKKFLKEIARTTSKETREAKLKVLIEDTRHHVKEEENEMFPMVKDQFSSEELDTLGTRLEAEKKKFQKVKKIPARREPPKGAVASMFEKAKEFVATALAGGTTAPPRSTAKKPAAKASSNRKAANGKAKVTPAKSSRASKPASSKSTSASKPSSSKAASRPKAKASSSPSRTKSAAK